MTHEWFDLGPVAAFNEFPARVIVHGQSYFLIERAGGYELLSTRCPHQGGEVRDIGECFECPHHGWQFDRSSGAGLTTPSSHLSAFAVMVSDGRMVADIPRPTEQPRRSGVRSTAPVSVQLHAHACLEIVHRGFSLLTDPWLTGPAFFGAWTQYPPPLVQIDTLRPDAIWISHEHSDHFHEPTMARFDRSIPVLVPDFPNRRLVRRLAALGFVNVRAMKFGEAVTLGEGITLTCFEPASLWNDAVVLIDVDGFRILNINDAGLNPRIAALVGRVDAMASSFSPGASGYPATWRHLDDTGKMRILESARSGLLQMLRDAAALYGCDYVLPFASHFALWHPDHAHYRQLQRPNTVDDVVAAFAGSDVQVIDLLPGEKWDVATGDIARTWRRRDRLYDRDRVEAHLARAFRPEVFAAHYPADETIGRSEIEQYLLQLNDTAEIAFTEPVSVRVRAVPSGSEDAATAVWFAIADGRLRITAAQSGEPGISIDVPMGVLSRIVRDGQSWDEAFIGYWCSFSRSPDVFHAGFWRLLQAPYFQKPTLRMEESALLPVAASTILAELIEAHGDRAERILRRHGLYCTGCQHSTAESIAIGARQHGLGTREVGRLLDDLNATLRFEGHELEAPRRSERLMLTVVGELAGTQGTSRG